MHLDLPGDISETGRKGWSNVILYEIALINFGLHGLATGNLISVAQLP
jgi:hypothetical protein